MANLGMPTKFGTVWVIGLCAVALIAWDIYAAMSTTQPTISVLTLSTAQKHPILPFLTGVLCGHLFWPQVTKEK